MDPITYNNKIYKNARLKLKKKSKAQPEVRLHP